jgi:hypothetical protein
MSRKTILGLLTDCDSLGGRHAGAMDGEFGVLANAGIAGYLLFPSIERI